jgi:hypothetical protein
MTIEEPTKVDFTAIEPRSGDVLLVICDHLDWDANEGEHLLKLQEKLNSYLALIETGQLYRDWPKTVGRKIIIEVLGKSPLSEEARKFYRLAEKAIEDAGFSLRFKHFDGE